MKQLRRSPILAFGFAVAVPLFALFLQKNAELFIGLHFFLFYPSVYVTAYLFGFGPGLVSTAVSTLLVQFFLIQPRYSLAVSDATDWLPVALFFGMGTAISWLAGKRYESQHKLALKSAELASKAADLSDFVENATIGLHWVGPDGTILWANQAELNLLGYSKQEYIGRPISDFHADQPVIDDILCRLTSGEQLINYEARLRAKDGSIKHVVIDSSVYFENGKFKHTRCFTRDITEQKRHQETNEFFASVSLILSLSIDLETTLKKIASLAVSKLGDWCVIDLVGKGGPYQATVAHPDPKILKLAQEFRQKYPPVWDAPFGAPNVIRTGKAELYSDITPEQLLRSARDEEHLKILLGLGMRSAMVLPIVARGKTIGALTLVSTQESRRYTEAELSVAKELGQRAGFAIENSILYQEAKAAIRIRDEFLSIASHELKTPITSLKLQLQLTKRKFKLGDGFIPKPQEVERVIDVSTVQVNRLEKLIEDLLDVSRIASGKLALELEQVDLVEIVNETLFHHKEYLDHSGCQIEFKPEKPLLICCDRSKMVQVISNLLTNAAKYGAGKPVHILVEQTPDSSARLVVQDFGMGIPKDKQEKIFDRFERAIGHTNISGLGLGLFITREIVNAHKGTIRVESEPGHGSIFTVEIPLGSSEQDQGLTHMKPSASSGETRGATL